MIIKRNLRLLLNKYKVNTASFLKVKKSQSFFKGISLKQDRIQWLAIFQIHIYDFFYRVPVYIQTHVHNIYFWILNNQNEIISIIIIFSFCRSLHLKKKVVSYCRNKQLLTCKQVSKTEMKIWGNPYLKIETHKTNTC